MQVRSWQFKRPLRRCTRRQKLRTVAAVGLPAIDGLGPRGGGFHTLDEFVELDSFGPKAEALLRFLYARQLAPQQAAL